MTSPWRIAITDLDWTPVLADMPWAGFEFRHVRAQPGSAEIEITMAKVARADIEPGQRNYVIYDGATPRAAGRIWRARADTRIPRQNVRLIGEGIGGILGHRLVNWQARYEPITESPANLNTAYGLSQEEILWDQIERTQAETAGDLGITQGAHIGGSHLRRRWYCAEDGVFLSEIFEEFAGLDDGVDWAITPTLSDGSLNTFTTWNPGRGSDLSGSVVLAGTDYLDTLDLDIDASQVVTRGRSTGTGQCEPPAGDDTDATALAAYGLLEDFEQSQSDHQDDADETATALLSPSAVVGQELEYQLPKGPALGDFDVDDIIHYTSPRNGWEIDADIRVQEIKVSVQLPGEYDHTFVAVNYSEIGEGGS